MQGKRLRIKNQIENYKAMEIAFRRNGNGQKALEMRNKIEQLQRDLIMMSANGIQPEQSQREKNWKRRQKLKQAFRIIFYLMFAIVIIALLIVLQENRELRQQVKELTIIATAIPTEIQEPARGGISRLEPIGTFVVYHYCPCEQCCGKTDGVTATGTKAEEGRTIAVDPAVIPLGTEVIIDGHRYIAEDTGSGIQGNKIDIFVESHEEALQLGVTTAEVYIERR